VQPGEGEPRFRQRTGRRYHRDAAVERTVGRRREQLGLPDPGFAARLAERARIYAALAADIPLLNVERELLAGQIPLI